MIEDEQNLRKILAKAHKQKTPKNAIKPKTRSRKMYQKTKHLLIHSSGYSNEQQLHQVTLVRLVRLCQCKDFLEELYFCSSK